MTEKKTDFPPGGTPEEIELVKAFHEAGLFAFFPTPIPGNPHRILIDVLPPLSSSPSRLEEHRMKNLRGQSKEIGAFRCNLFDAIKRVGHESGFFLEEQMTYLRIYRKPNNPDLNLKFAKVIRDEEFKTFVAGLWEQHFSGIEMKPTAKPESLCTRPEKVRSSNVDGYKPEEKS